MRKKLISTIFPFLLSASLLAGCGSASAQPPSNESASQSESSFSKEDDAEATAKHEDSDNSMNVDNTTQTDNTTDIPSDEASFDSANHTDTPNQVLNVEEFISMEKALDSLMLCSLENNLTYDSHDPLYFWCSLFYGVVNYTDEIPLAEETPDGILVPRMAVEEFASGLFADYDDLLEIPAEFPIAQYIAEQDSYLFIAADRGMIYTKLLNASVTESGDTLLSAALYDSETNMPFCCYEFTLIENPYAADTVEPLFPYAVSSMTRTDAISSSSEAPTLIGSYQGFSDSHTAEFIIDSNLNAFQVYDANIIAFLSSLETDTELTFAVEKDELTEMRTIISILSK